MPNYCFKYQETTNTGKCFCFRGRKLKTSSHEEFDALGISTACDKEGEELEKAVVVRSFLGKGLWTLLVSQWGWKPLPSQISS